MNDIVNKQSFFDAWSGLSVPLQRKAINEWLTKPENIELYYEWLDEWERANLLETGNTDSAYKYFLDKSEKPSPVILPQSRFFLFKNRASRITAAAAAILVFFTTAFFLSKDRILYKSIATTFGETKRIVLPDGSEVFLNANSGLKYARFGFVGLHRTVVLKGEAEFSVVHTKDNSHFEVFADNDVKIAVLGTRFLVYSRRDETKVVLSQGKIELSLPVGDKMEKNILLPGDVFLKNQKDGIKRIKVKNPEELASWKNHEFHFDRTTLKEIAALINETYGYKISFETQALSNKSISGSFHAETVEELVDALAQLLHLNYKSKDFQIYFSE